MTSPSITTAGGNPIQFITTGSAGSVDYGTGTVPTGPGAVPPGGYAVGAAAVAAATSAAFDSSDGPYVAQPPSGTAQSNPAYNPVRARDRDSFGLRRSPEGLSRSLDGLSMSLSRCLSRVMRSCFAFARM